MKDQTTLMLIGLGGLGEAVLEFLAREEEIGKIVVGSRNVKRGEERCNLARMGATAQGYHPEIEFVPLDIDHVDETADLIYRVSPDIILNTASMMTWWYPSLFPEEQREELERAGFGVWLPIHLHLVMKLMQTLKLVNFKGHSLNASFPDVVNPILKARGVTPTAGIGNLDEVIPKLKLLGSEKIGVRTKDLKVTMVGHHALEKWVFGGRSDQPPPFYLKVEFEGRDVTEQMKAKELLFGSYPLPKGSIWQHLSAGSAVRMVKALLSAEDVHLHAPGLNGLPGGYPVTASKSGLKLALPGELSLNQAIEINEASHPFDGVQQIEPDGSVVFCQESVEIMHQTLGYECERLMPWETESIAAELIARVKAFATKYGIELPGVTELG
jgi:hypothetical protein